MKTKMSQIEEIRIKQTTNKMNHNLRNTPTIDQSNNRSTLQGSFFYVYHISHNLIRVNVLGSQFCLAFINPNRKWREEKHKAANLHVISWAYGKGWPWTPQVLLGLAIPYPSMPWGRATPKTALWPFQGWPGRRASGLQPSSIPWTPHKICPCVIVQVRIAAQLVPG
jgi:hypothetical protein